MQIESPTRQTRQRVFPRGLICTGAFALCGFGLLPAVIGQTPASGPPASSGSFLEAKTLFQTGRRYDPRIAIAADGVIIHRHGEDPAVVRATLASWREQGFPIARMFFADSDATNEYWTGKWDGTPHPQEVERDARGEVVKCAGVRPYMLPTDGWIRYLEKMAARSIDAGAEAILPEEPLAHAFTGYEQSFRDLWRQRYGRPWTAESASREARFLTARLMDELYIKLERRLLHTVRAEGRRVGRKVGFVVPIHSLYSNIAAELVAPLGTSTAIGDIDGYIGQVWTGPVNWARHRCKSPRPSFFASAYALYDYFTQLVVGTDKRLWLLTDPVEDNPRHQWPEFERWYRQCVVAELLFPAIDHFEVMPWPERIYMPGFSTGGGTPAPQRFRIVVLSAVQVLQEIPRGGTWQRVAPDSPTTQPTRGVGVAVSDTAMWERDASATLQSLYGALTPLIDAGVPVSACIMERSGEPAYLARFKVIVLSYDAWKPIDAKIHANLARWVRDGGALVLLGGADNLDDAPFWWKKQGYASPLDHLAALLGVDPNRAGETPVGRGCVWRRLVSPARFATASAACDEYLPLIDRALRRAGVEEGLATPGGFCLRRGPFVIAAATRRPLKLPGKLLDVFDPELPILSGVTLPPGAGGVYRDVGAILDGSAADSGRPRVLHATHRLVEDRFADGVSHVVIRGPAETPAVVRLYTAGRTVRRLALRGPDGRELSAEIRRDGPTLRVRFPNQPRGAVLEIHWQAK